MKNIWNFPNIVDWCYLQLFLRIQVGNNSGKAVFSFSLSLYQCSVMDIRSPPIALRKSSWPPMLSHYYSNFLEMVPNQSTLGISAGKTFVSPQWILVSHNDLVKFHFQLCLSYIINFYISSFSHVKFQNFKNMLFIGI